MIYSALPFSKHDRYHFPLALDLATESLTVPYFGSVCSDTEIGRNEQDCTSKSLIAPLTLRSCYYCQ